jgi:hypothetical protein
VPDAVSVIFFFLDVVRVLDVRYSFRIDKR